MAVTNDTQSRKWLLTINNPHDNGYTHEKIKELLSEFKSCAYWCMSDEIGLESRTYHTHVFLSCSSAVRFSTVKKKFPTAHIDVCAGTSQQNKDYVFKEGKHTGSKKEDTRVANTQEEWGELPIERQGKRNDLDDLYDMIKSGLSNYEIVEASPNYMLHMDKIERVRQTILEEKYKNEWRTLDVTYIYGLTGMGKTRGVMETYGYDKVFRITDYQHPFDAYSGQNVIVFEEFYSANMKMSDMLNYLDGYPLELPCRYANKRACFTKIYIISNIALEEQYKGVQDENPEKWNALLRRIHKVKVYNGTDTREYEREQYFLENKGFSLITKTPFD